jgi:hypothetical protein
MIEDNGEREITPKTLLDFFDNSIYLTHSKIFFCIRRRGGSRRNSVHGYRACLC